MLATSFVAFVALCAPVIHSLPSAHHRRTIHERFDYEGTKVRGVNLGGWLLLEPFITPSIFDNTGDDRIVDEYTFGQYAPNGKAVLKEHWDTWITEDDFAAISLAGLNHVRIPIGFWAFETSGGEPYISGQYPYLQKAVTWAAAHGVKVMIDLHGAPGSQNGFDNSGLRTDNPTWHANATNIERTLAIVDQLAAEFSKEEYANVVTAIAPLNEPSGFRSQAIIDAAEQYWKDSYNVIREKGDLAVFPHDTFQDLSYWTGKFNPPEYEGLYFDTHHYEIFDNAGVAMTHEQHINAACQRGRDVAAWASSNTGVIVGEWSTAAYDCAKYLNGRGLGARYDGTYPDSTYIGDCAPFTGDSSKWSADYKAFLRQYWEAQATAFELSTGWIFWTWKTESADEWSYSKGIEGGWIPSNPTERLNPSICG